MSDGKLNFLCNLDLFPTPLIKKCPNTTKRWLRAVPNPDVTQDIGINSGYHEIDNSPSKVNFMPVGMVDGTECSDNTLFPNLPANDSIDHAEPTIAEPMDKNEDCGFDFQKEKCIYTYVDQCTLGSKSRFPIFTSGITTVCVTNQNSTPTGSSDIKTVPPQNLCGDKITMFNTDSIPCSSSIIGHQNLRTQDHPVFESQQIPFQLHELYKKTKINKDLQDTVLNEIIVQEINQTIFAKASIGKTQGYLSELLRTSKLLEDKSDKEYRRTRHNLDKIRQFLKKPKYERKRIYEEISGKKTVPRGKDHCKQKRTVLSADAKKYLCEYFCSNNRNLSCEDFQFLASHLKLDVHNVKIFYKNWKQRTKIKTCLVE